MLIVFQPHLFSRTRDFADEFAKVLDKADEVILLPVYPARELPIEGISSDTILTKMRDVKRQIMKKQKCLHGQEGSDRKKICY